MRSLRDLPWILPCSLVLGLGLSLLSPGKWWLGWLAYALVLALGLWALALLWRSAETRPGQKHGSQRVLGLMLLLAVVLRMGLGMAFSAILPSAGNPTEVQEAGYIFPDAYNRDVQSWELASSSNPLWRAFDKSYSTDQYGGLLFVSSLFYRYLSPDAHRPWLIILLTALASAIGVALAWKTADKSWGRSMALGLGWIMALYPEAILMGSSQMREPFLISLVAMAFWGVTAWADDHRTAAAWLIGSLVGMLLFSPGIAAISMLLLAGWIWLPGKERRIRWGWIAGLGVVVLLAFLLLSWSVGGSLQVQNGLVMNLVTWLKYTMKFDASVTTFNSGWLQTVFMSLPKPLHLPFIIAYGVAQPVLPAAIIDPGVWPVRALGILRAMGWYALLPLLLYSLWPIWRMTDKRQRLAWLWLWLVTWIWILLASARAGGDQWDNPRYRVILLIFQAILAVKAVTWQRATHDRWLGRLLAMEGVFLVLFGYWYFTRKTSLNLKIFNVFEVLAAIVIVSAAILVTGWLRDRWQVKKEKR
jgi:hypothetical protein